MTPQDTCRICDGHADPQPWGGRVCRARRSISVTDLPSAADLDAFYQSFHADYHGGGRARGAAERQARYALAYLAEVRQRCSSGRAVDIGSSTNPLPSLLAAGGYETLAIDIARPGGLDPRVEFVAGSLDEGATVLSNLEGRAFDVVSNFAVIEHCRNPRGAAKTMAALCRTGGHLILTTPEIGRFADRHFLGRSRWFCPPEHLHLISREGMRRMFAESGCELIVTRRFELTALRWAARYGILWAEGCLGFLTRYVAPGFWRRRRATQVARGQGIALYVFRKTG